MDKETLKKTLAAVRIAVIAIALAVIGFSGIYTVSEQERAVITQFGKVIGESGAGLHFKIPFIQNVRKVNMTTVGMTFGYQDTGGMQQSIEGESFMITKDFNFVNVDFYVEWRVSSPTAFLYHSEDPVGLLRNILQSEARSVVSSYIVDDVLTTAKSAIQTAVREGVMSKVDEYDIGIFVSNVSLQDAEPPTAAVVSAFKNVENAKQHKDTEINGANKYANEIIPQARAEADKITKDAEAVREARINEATGQTARFNAMFSEYIRNKEITKTRMYLEAMEEIMPGMKTIVGGEDITKILDLSKSADADTVRNAAVDAAGGTGSVTGADITTGLEGMEGGAAQ